MANEIINVSLSMNDADGIRRVRESGKKGTVMIRPDHRPSTPRIVEILERAN